MKDGIQDMSSVKLQIFRCLQKMSKDKIAVICEVLVIIVCIIQFATGAQYLTVGSNNNILPFQVFQSDAGIFIFSGCFSIVASIVSLILMGMAGKNYHTHNASYFLTLLSFCLQASVAVVAACYTTIHEQNLSGVNNVSYNVSTLVNLQLAQAVLSFVLACPALAFLLQIRWEEWAIFMTGSFSNQPFIVDTTIKQALR